MTDTAIKAQQDAVRELKALEGDLLVKGQEKRAAEARAAATAGMKTLRWLHGVNGNSPHRPAA